MSIADGFRKLLTALDDLGIRYALGGSLASSSRGIPRSTVDVDLIVAISENEIEALAVGLGKEWYFDMDTGREAVRTGRSFNLILIPLSHKFDIFPAKTAFHRAQIERGSPARIGLEDDEVECQTVSAEDIILAKLVWLRETGGASERQESDIRGVLCANDDLDWEYIDSWAAKLGVIDLLERFTEPPDKRD